MSHPNLFLHRDGEKDYKVHNENRPEDGDVEEIKKGAEQSDENCSNCGIPGRGKQTMHIHKVN